MIQADTSSRGNFVWLRVDFTAEAASYTAGTSDKDPRKEPTGVRLAATTTVLYIMV